MAECEVKVWGDWKLLTLAQALELDPSHLKRCPECHGQARLHRASIDGMVVHFEHYEPIGVARWAITSMAIQNCTLGRSDEKGPPDIGEIC